MKVVAVVAVQVAPAATVQHQRVQRIQGVVHHLMKKKIPLLLVIQNKIIKLLLNVFLIHVWVKLKILLMDFISVKYKNSYKIIFLILLLLFVFKTVQRSHT